MPAPLVPAPPAVADLSAPQLRVTHGSWRSALEVLWERRTVEVYGTLIRVTLPIIGAAVPPALPARLSAELSTRWLGRALDTDLHVRSVVADVQVADGQRALVLMIAAGDVPRGHPVVNRRMARDVRQALRTVRYSSST